MRLLSRSEENFPKASITFDKFHVIQKANEAVDEVRRTKRKSCAELKDTRYLWLKNPENLTAAQQETMAKLKDCDLDTAKAYRMRLILQEIYRYPMEAFSYSPIWFSRERKKYERNKSNDKN